MQDLNITLVQDNLHWQDPAANRRHFSHVLEPLRDTTDLIILPEMLTTGFTMDAQANAEGMDGPSMDWLRNMAQRTGSVICGSLIIEAQGSYYNRLIWMRPDGTHGHYDKRHLFRMAQEQKHYSAGTSRSIFTLKGWRICPLVCYDLRFPVWSRGVNEFELLIYIANWPAARRSAWQVLLPARAVENLCFAAGVNRIGTDGNDRDYCGDSSVFDYLGRPLNQCKDTPCVTTVTLDAAALKRYREKFPAWLDADRFELR